MIESPVLQELIAQTRQKSILDLLQARFDKQVPDDMASLVRRIGDPDRLQKLLIASARCADLAAFRQAAQSALYLAEAVRPHGRCPNGKPAPLV